MIRTYVRRAAYLLLASLAATTAFAGGRVFQGTYPAKGLETIKLDVAVGDATIIAGTADIITFHVRLTPHHGGLFSSLAEARKQIQAAQLQIKPTGATLSLSIRSPGTHPHFEATWTISVPPRLGAAVRTGVGDVTIRGIDGPLTVKDGVGDVMIHGIRGPLTVKDGVGDVMVHGIRGPLTVKDGVGDVTIRADQAQFGQITATAGVGDAELKTADRTLSGTGMVGKHLTWTGPGRGTMHIKTGVGDIEVTLQPAQLPEPL